MKDKIKLILKIFNLYVNIEFSGSTDNKLKVDLLKKIREEINSLISFYTKGE